VADFTFTGIDDPRIPRNIRTRSATEIQAWVTSENERLAVVGTCEKCSPPHPLMASEVEPHRLTHMSTRARVIVGMLMAPRTKPEAIKEVRAYLDSITT
jgi:hypothetical protein